MAEKSSIHRRFTRESNATFLTVVDFVGTATLAFTGPVRSAANYIFRAAPIVGDVIQARHPEILKYFPVEELDGKVSVETNNDTASLISEVIRIIDPDSGYCQEFMGRELMGRWSACKEGVCKDSGLNLTDYVARIGRHFYLAGIKDGEIGLYDLASRSYYHVASMPTDLTKVEMELSILEALKRLDVDDDPNLRVYQFSSIANGFEYKRHPFLEREGEFFTTLRHFGVSNLGELQAVAHDLFGQSLGVDEEGNVLMDPDLLKRWVEIRKLPLFKSDIEVDNLISDEALKFANEQIYYRLTVSCLKKYVDFVSKFMETEVFAKYSYQFKDRHAAAFGATEMSTAINMLAGFYLYKFEGPGPLEESPSQSYLAKIPGYHQEIGQFIEEFSGVKPDVEFVDGENILAQQSDIIRRIVKEKNPDVVSASKVDRDHYIVMEKTQCLSKADLTLPKAKKQLRRNLLHRRAIEFLRKTGHVVSEGEQSRVGLDASIIANIGLKRARSGDQLRFMCPWLINSSGYLGPDINHALPPFNEKETTESLERIIRDVFSGQGEYRDQNSRIIENAPGLLHFLKSDDRVPQAVRKFISTVDSDQLIVKVLERFGNAKDNDPNIVNRFFPDGVSHFQLSSKYRYIFDFVRGVETNILLMQANKSGIAKKIAGNLEATVGDWRNNNFSQLSDEELQQAISQTLRDGNSRIVELNHAIEDLQGYYPTLKTYQEKLEIIVGWNTKGLEFTRWTRFWDIWHTLGGAWDCICFSRKTIFNPRSIKTAY